MVSGSDRTSEKRKVGGSTPPLTTIQLAIDEALTSAKADWTFPCLSQASDHDCPHATVVGRSLSHADRTPCFRVPGLFLFVPN